MSFPQHPCPLSATKAMLGVLSIEQQCRNDYFSSEAVKEAIVTFKHANDFRQETWEFLSDSLKDKADIKFWSLFLFSHPFLLILEQKSCLFLRGLTSAISNYFFYDTYRLNFSYAFRTSNFMSLVNLGTSCYWNWISKSEYQNLYLMFHLSKDM